MVHGGLDKVKNDTFSGLDGAGGMAGQELMRHPSRALGQFLFIFRMDRAMLN